MKTDVKEWHKYIDSYGSVLDNPREPGDSCFHSSYLYASECVFDENIDKVEKFLVYFSEHCLKHDRLIGHPNMYTDKVDKSLAFSRDQLSPLLLLLAVVHKYQPQLKPYCKKILQKIVDLDHDKGNIAGGHRNGDVNNNLRYIISILCEAYGVGYGRAKGETWFSKTLAAYELAWRQPLGNWLKPSWKPRPYTINNNANLLTVRKLLLNSNRHRSNFRWFGKNWYHGIGYKIIAGLPFNQSEISAYISKKSIYMGLFMDRGIESVSDEEGYHVCFDYWHLEALRRIWK